jgi:hypothetical protein
MPIAPVLRFLKMEFTTGSMVSDAIAIVFQGEKAIRENSPSRQKSRSLLAGKEMPCNFRLFVACEPLFQCLIEIQSRHSPKKLNNDSHTKR